MLQQQTQQLSGGYHPALAFPVLPVQKLQNTPEELENLAANLDLIAELESKVQSQLIEGDAKTQSRYTGNGMLLARDRIRLLVDQDSPWLEIGLFAGYEEGKRRSGSSIAGIGLVHGVPVIISSNCPVQDSGAYTPIDTQKDQRVRTIALENKLPQIHLLASAGANLKQQDSVFHIGGNMFRARAQNSQAGIPSCSVVFNSAAAGGAYIAGMSDFTIMVKEQGHLFLGGPALVKMATGESTTAEELGGADLHARITGSAEQLAYDDFEAISMAREWVAGLNWRSKTLAASRPTFLELPPIVDMDSLLQIAQSNIRKPWDLTELLARVLDGSRFSAYKPLYGTNLVTGWGFIFGYPIGVVASNAVMSTEEGNKATSFIKLCNTRDVPIIFLHNINGFMVGAQYEASGILKAGSAMVNAVSNSKVPHISLICGASYGAANFAMCSRAFNPRFLFSWPQARCGAMGPDSMAGVMDQVTRDSAAKRKTPIDEVKQARNKAHWTSEMERQTNCYYLSGRLLDDAIIDPRETRSVLGFCLALLNQQKISGEPGFNGISRL